MGDWTSVVSGADAVTREMMLFAAIGFLIGGIDDLAVDLIYLVRSLWRRLTVFRRHSRATLDDFVLPSAPGRMAIFVATWDEAGVIGAMLTTALARLDHPDYRIYVGTYPNDRATIDAVAAVAERDPRVRLVIGERPGPTTKADCLNTIWRALSADEAAGASPAKAIVIHDAEDVVHPGELRVFDRLIDRAALVQLPVLPLPHRGSRLVSGTYMDEFAEAHAKQMVVREALGAGLPLAGVGCAIARPTLAAVAAARDGFPFDATSLTEDYELGLKIGAIGGRSMLARVRDHAGGPIVATRAYFPTTIDAAVRQKARWMTGIALAGWDRTGWARWRNLADHWMRMRDRRAPLAIVVLVTAYGALIAWAAGMLGHALTDTAPTPLSAPIKLLLAINSGFLAWRLAMRVIFTAQAYGRDEALLAIPRALVGNLIAMLAARRAIATYLALLAGGPPRWDKTRHVFPGPAEAGAVR